MAELIVGGPLEMEQYLGAPTFGTCVCVALRSRHVGTLQLLLPLDIAGIAMDGRWGRQWDDVARGGDHHSPAVLS